MKTTLFAIAFILVGQGPFRPSPPRPNDPGRQDKFDFASRYSSVDLVPVYDAGSSNFLDMPSGVPIPAAKDSMGRDVVKLQFVDNGHNNGKYDRIFIEMDQKIKDLESRVAALEAASR